MYLYMPKLGMAMEEGVIVEWLVADGEWVEVSQPLYIVNNEKLDTEIESQYEGTLRVLAIAGESYPVGTAIAELVASSTEDGSQRRTRPAV